MLRVGVVLAVGKEKVRARCQEEGAAEERKGGKRQRGECVVLVLVLVRGLFVAGTT